MAKRMVLIALGGVLLVILVAACGSSDETEISTSPSEPASSQSAADAASDQSAADTTATEPVEEAEGVVKLVNQDEGGSGDYRFVPSSFTFKQGETVTFSMTSETEFHTFNLDDLGVSQSVEGGETVRFTITFDTKGNFRFYCIPHEDLGMEGTLRVE